MVHHLPDIMSPYSIYDNSLPNFQILIFLELLQYIVCDIETGPSLGTQILLIYKCFLIAKKILSMLKIDTLHHSIK